MPAEWIATVGNESQIEKLLNGVHLKGRSEGRIAMIGRSNVGKSSLINALVRNKVAQVSQEPGKTRAIHFYLWKNRGRIIADLPGYGYARTAMTERQHWGNLINAYLEADQGLERALVLLDARHGPTDLDLEAIRFLSFGSIPVTFVFTKADTLRTQSERATRRKEASEALRQVGFDPGDAFWISVKDDKKGAAPFLAGLKSLEKTCFPSK